MLTSTQILRTAAEVTGHPVDVIVGRWRAKEVVCIRAAVAQLIRLHVGCSYARIGKILDRDHTSILYYFEHYRDNERAKLLVCEIGTALGPKEVAIKKAIAVLMCSCGNPLMVHSVVKKKDGSIIRERHCNCGVTTKTIETLYQEPQKEAVPYKSGGNKFVHPKFNNWGFE